MGKNAKLKRDRKGEREKVKSTHFLQAESKGPGRPSFGDNLKPKLFNLPLDMIGELQARADKEQGAPQGRGNLSMLVRKALAKYLAKE